MSAIDAIIEGHGYKDECMGKDQECFRSRSAAPKTDAENLKKVDRCDEVEKSVPRTLALAPGRLVP